MSRPRTGGAARLFRRFDLAKRFLRAAENSSALASSLVNRINERPDLDDIDRAQFQMRREFLDKINVVIKIANE